MSFYKLPFISLIRLNMITSSRLIAESCRCLRLSKRVFVRCMNQLYNSSEGKDYNFVFYVEMYLILVITVLSLSVVVKKNRIHGFS